MTDPISCPDAAQLKHLLEGTLPEGEQSVLHEHLETCAPCQQTLQSLAAGSAAWSGAARHLKEEEEAKPAALQRAVAELEAETGAAQTRGQPGPGTDLPLDFLSPSDKPGHLGKLGHYEVQEVIGRGGMGIVLKAFDEKLHRVVAIKVMAPQLAVNATARKRFVREAQAAAAIRDDHVINIYAVEEGPSPYPLPQGGEGSGLPYLVMEYISGQSLQERLDESGPLQLKEILRIGMQTANGLAAAHAQGLIHRDIKPANILMENGVERVKITDFGLARAADDAAGLTQSGVVAGTPQYMSPEQSRAEPLDHRSDLFSLGSMLYAMCTGRAPFRAANTVAVLRRVSDDLTRPIREINPDIPDWLVAIVEKLHAKEPADRYQTAAEVAELLGRHLAQLQQPSLVPLPITPPVSPPSQGVEKSRRVAGAEALRSPGQRLPSPLGGRGVGGEGLAGASKTQPRPPTAVALASKPWHTRRWVAAAAVLLIALGVLAITEATGVTKVTEFVATVLEIRTAEGTLIVEVDDPNVKVTIEGDGGLVITGAGPQEVRLKPGSYKVEASKDGKPVKSEVVTITRNGKKVVTVQIEGPPAGAAGRAEKQAFVLLGSKGIAERKFETLAEAVRGASDGDTIEVRGNGPFETKPIVINQRALTIRAGAGFRPVVMMSEEAARWSDLPMLETSGGLVLEGLELHRPAQEAGKPGQLQDCVIVSRASLHVANCRFRLERGGLLIDANSSTFVVRNCEFLGGIQRAVISSSGGSSCTLDNCLAIGPGAGVALHLRSEMPVHSIHLARNTFVTKQPSIDFQLMVLPHLSKVEAGKSVRLEGAGNIFASDSVVRLAQSPDFLAKEKALSTAEAESLLQRLCGWHGSQNVYDDRSAYLRWVVDGVRQPAHSPKSLEEWKEFWASPESESQQGRVRFQGGELLAKFAEAPDKISPDDFRLRADSAGYRAGKDGKDLGADVDLVGPGAAYERWKKTPEYQQWLKDTGQLRAEAPKPEPKAFVVMGGKGVAERKFDTLAEAVQNASDGDTIEIRGNGPFDTQPISIEGHALTIRAGQAYRPVIRLKLEELHNGAAIFVTDAPLVLEGLELRLAGQGNQERGPDAVVSNGAPVYMANCTLVNKRNSPYTGLLLFHQSRHCELRNCLFLAANGSLLNWTFPADKGELVMHNCVRGGNVTINLYNFRHNPHDISIQVTRTTTVTNERLIYFNLGKPLDLPVQAIRLEATENVFETGPLFQLNQDAGFYQASQPLAAGQAQALVPGLLDWHGERNLYSVRRGFFTLSIGKDGQELLPPATPIETLKDWNRFLNTQDTASLEGRARYQGGALLTRIQAAVEQLTPDDFRLRPDSPGYRAGKDGKDLGADVDLVGPGAAYERWKKTPEYQQWLKDTGQGK